MANGLNRDFDGHEQVSARRDNLLIAGAYSPNCTASAARRTDSETGSDSFIGGQSEYHATVTLNKYPTGLFACQQA